VWDRFVHDVGPVDPIFAMALRWLRVNVPTGAGRTVLVQGDTGPGNFLYADGRVTAVLDWELAHLGDPHDDLAWICVRDLQERFTSLPDRFAEYERLSGARVDVDRLRYFRILAETRCSIGAVAGVNRADAGGELANLLVYSTLHLRALAEDLADLVGAEVVPDPLADAGPTPHTPFFDAVLHDIRNTIVPSVGSEFALRRSKAMARLVKYLREVDRLGGEEARAELDDLGALLPDRPNRPATVAAGRQALSAAIEAGEVAVEAAATYAVRRMARTVQVLRPAMGALADRHFSPIGPSERAER
jgi:hypothetical protein